VTLFAAWTDEVASPRRALLIVFFGNGEGGAAAAWNHEQPKRRLFWGVGGHCLKGFETGLKSFERARLSAAL
jgi:hypothetical protein